MMKKNWLKILPKNPLPTLKDWPDEALTYFVGRDLLGEHFGQVKKLWDLPEVKRFIKIQREDGSWKYPGRTPNLDIGQNYSLLETYRNLRILVEAYGLTRDHPSLKKAAEYIFSCQTTEGDIRGIIGNQYMPYYHGAILELLIKAGYSNDRRVKRGLDWLLSVRQDDGGWVVPAQIVPPKMRSAEFWLSAPIPPDRSRPHAHLATGMVLRAFAYHPDYQHRPEVVAAGEALKNRFFRADKYNDRKAKSYWLKFQFPFWWCNLLTALDSLYEIGFEREDADIRLGLDWFIDHQDEDGLWSTGYSAGKKAEANRIWVGLAICRMLKGFYER